MELNSTEAKYIASRLYAQDLVLRLICSRMQQSERDALLSGVNTYRDLMLAEAVPDAQAEELAAYATRIISGPRPPG